MPKIKKSKKHPSKPGWADNITLKTFEGLNISSIGAEPSVRNVPPPSGSQYECKQKLSRERLAKVENDMTRNLLKAISRAMENQVQLPFYVADFEKARDKGIPIFTAGPFGDLAGQPRRLTIDKGPAVVTDLEGIPVLWYLPRFIGPGLQVNLMRSIGELAHVYQPPADHEIQDRRANTLGSKLGRVSVPHRRYSTRSQISETTGITGAGTELHQAEEDLFVGQICTLEEPTTTQHYQPCPERYTEVEGKVRWNGDPQAHSVGLRECPAISQDSKPLALSTYDPVAYYFSPGWSQTGMEYVRPIQMSLHFRNALCQGLEPTIRFLETKRLLDKQIAQLTQIIQPSLSESMRELRSHMSAIPGPTGAAVINGWTSAFPCFGVAINRVTGMHRDTKGLRAGLDVIGVLGTFTDGGDLELPDLNLRLEWAPGCLGAFDGYDFRHKVHKWSGGSRVALISFCRKSTWAALELTPNLTRPTIADCRDKLSCAIERRRTFREAQRKREVEVERGGGGK